MAADARDARVGGSGARGAVRLGILVASLLVFALDAALVSGIAGSILYLPVIWLAFRSERLLDVYATAGFCTLLVLIDVLLSPVGGDTTLPDINSVLGIAAIWMTAALCGQVIRARDRAQASRERFRLLLDSTAEAIYGIDLDGLCMFCNPACARMLGYESPDDLLGLDMHALSHHTRRDGSTFPESECRIRAAFHQGIGMHADDEFFWRKDGTGFPVEYWSHPMKRGDDIVGSVVTFFDITERLEDARYRAQMAALVDSSYDAIIGRDTDGRIISWNLGAERVYGWTEDEAIDQTSAIILPPDGERAEEEMNREVRTGRRLEQFETLRRHKDGHLIPVSLTVSPITDGRGEVIGSSTIERDITEIKRNEEELRKAKEAAEKAMRVRAEFLANVSHELRTPMNAIIGMSQLALGEDLSEEVREYVHTANESAHSLLTLLNDILDFSKLESGKFSVEREPFDLRELLDETVKTLSPRAFQKGLELVCDVEVTAPERLIGDGIRLRQVLTNLLGNAIKFTESGEVILSVRTVRKWPREARLRFSVSDTGLGISAEDQRRILQPFEQADSSSTRMYGGTGLGLAICNELLRLMGGRLSIQSEPGAGSCFSFELSLTRRFDPDKESVDLAPLQRLRQLPVLIVDDNETNLRFLSQTLDNWSMRPETARGGRDALSKLDEARAVGKPFDLVIVDGVMPEMDGYALSRRIVEDGPRDAPSVILMVSASDRREFRERIADKDAAVLLQKPVSQSDLMDAIVRAMNVESGSARPLQDPHQRPSTSAPLAILLAEDTPANQKVVTRLLSKRGHAVTIAHNGREAVERFRRDRFDVVLMDVQMPIMDGFQATSAIRDLEDDRDRSTPIIAMTAHAMRGDRDRCLQAGMDAYIAKPIDVDELLELVESVATRSETDGEPNRDDRRLRDGPPRTEARNQRPTAAESQESDERSECPRDSVVDLDGAMRRMAGDRDLFRDLARFFQEDSPQLLNTLNDAIGRGDAPSIQRAAHSLKGLAANFGAEACVSAAGFMEQLGRDGDLAGAADSLTDLKREVERLSRELERLEAGS